MLNTIKLSFLYLLLVFTSLKVFPQYRDITSAQRDCDFYKLVKVENFDGVSKITLFIPENLNKVYPQNNQVVFQYEEFGNKSGYIISLEKLKSRNTQKLNDKEYIDITNKYFQDDLNGNLSELEKILPPEMVNVKVVDADFKLLIDNKYFLRRISYYEDKRMSNAAIDNVTNFQFVTVFNKTKYSLNISFYGNSYKSVSELVGLFNTIGGSLKFN